MFLYSSTAYNGFNYVGFILQANPEHFVFSTFGVLHVYPDQPNETLSLADWQREAVLWNAISSVPFFKNFLVMKMFNK